MGLFELADNLLTDLERGVQEFRKELRSLAAVIHANPSLQREFAARYRMYKAGLTLDEVSKLGTEEYTKVRDKLHGRTSTSWTEWIRENISDRRDGCNGRAKR